MKVRIIKCKDSTMWYSDKIGREFTKILGISSVDEAWVWTEDAYLTSNWVYLEDVEMVKENV